MPSGGCNATRKGAKLLVTLYPIDCLVESASTVLRCVFLLSAIIVLFAGLVGKVLRENGFVCERNVKKGTRAVLYNILLQNCFTAL